MSHLTYAEAMVVGLMQGVTELFPVSSLGHSVLIPALIGGSWAQDLNVSAPESPYLAFIVGLSGLALEHTFRVVFSKPIPTSLFLAVNGVILLAAERRRRLSESRRVVPQAAMATAGAHRASPYGLQQETGRRQETDPAVAADRRLATIGYGKGIVIGAVQIFALLPGISRDGVVTVTGMARGLTREDAVRFSFLLSAPVILAAGVLKVPDLFGPLGAGIHGQVLVGSLLSGIGAYVSIRYLVRYFSRARSLTPFGIYCLAAGLGSLAYFIVR